MNNIPIISAQKIKEHDGGALQARNNARWEPKLQKTQARWFALPGVIVP